MRTVFIHIVLLLAGLAILAGCTKPQEELVLHSDYHHVADVLEYCQGPCNVGLVWEGMEILVKGKIPDVADSATMLNYYTDDHFYLHDIRNGMFMEVRITGDKEAIFEFLSGIGKTADVYISGTAESVMVNKGNECLKGVVIILSSSQNIKSNL